MPHTFEKRQRNNYIAIAAHHSASPRYVYLCGVVHDVTIQLVSWENVSKRLTGAVVGRTMPRWIHQAPEVSGGAYMLRVEMRQRQTPSLVLLFLCLKPPSIRSHTYCNDSTRTPQDKTETSVTLHFHQESQPRPAESET